MSRRPWFPWYPGDYRAKTGHLDFIHDAAYRRLLDAYYQTGGPLPSDRESLHRIISAISAEEKAAVEIVVVSYFRDDGFEISNKSADEHLKAMDQFAAAQRERGKLGAKARWNGHDHGASNASAIVPAMAQAMPKQWRIDGQPQSHSHSQEVKTICSERSALKADASPSVETLPLNDGTDFSVTENYVKELDRLFPAVDVAQTLREMRAWCLAKPQRRKTKRGVKAFITTWLSKEQDRHGR